MIRVVLGNNFEQIGDVLGKLFDIFQPFAKITADSSAGDIDKMGKILAVFLQVVVPRHVL